MKKTTIEKLSGSNSSRSRNQEISLITHLANHSNLFRGITRKHNDISVSPRGDIPREITIQTDADEISLLSIGNTELIPLATVIPHMLSSPLLDGTHEAFNINSTTELLSQRPRTFPVNVGQLPLEEHNKCLPRCTIL